MLAFAILALLAAPVRSRAFFDPATFTTPVLEGGGGGRFFTGSPADGQTCDTCHTGGQAPRVEVAGLPARYVPGATYELSVSWSPALGDVGAMLELTDEHGAGAGVLALPPSAEVSDDELCEPRTLQVLGTSLFTAAHGRAIAGVGGCGASALRVQWTAPKPSRGTVWLAGAIVVSNQQGDTEGDGVTTFVASAPSFGQKAAASKHDGCSVLLGPQRTTFAGAVAFFALGLLFICRRSKKQRCWMYVAACVLAACHHESLLDPGPPRSSGPVTLHAGEAVDPWEVELAPLDSGAKIEPPAAAGADAEAPSDADTSADADAKAPSLPPLRLRVTTLPQGGQFAPKNVGAIWVEDADGHWVKTLAVWVGVSLRYLSRYLKANRNGNTVDAITSSSLTMHQEHEVSWNLSNASGGVVPDGTYHVLVEVTDRNGPGQVLDLEFIKGAAPQEIAAPDTPYFTGVELFYAKD
jgi:hypothetical protein